MLPTGNQTNPPAVDGDAGQQTPTPQGQTVLAPEIQKAIADAAKAAEEQAFRRAQSYFEKSAGKTREKIAKLEEAWAAQAKAGVPVDENVKAQVRAAVVANPDILPDKAEPEGQPQAEGAPAQPLAQGQGQVHPMVQMVSEFEQEYGVQLMKDDPETNMVDISSPMKLAKTLPAALEAKKKREASEKNPVLPGMAVDGSGPVSDYVPGQGLKDLDTYFKNKKRG